MTTELSERPAAGLTPSQLDTYKRTLAPKATDDELAMFADVCRSTGLNPFARQIYMIPRWDSQTRSERQSIQVSIDGLRLVALRSGKYEGQEGPEWVDGEGNWHDAWYQDGPPAGARVGVKHADFTETLWAFARFRSYAGTKKGGELTSMWAKMPEVMIAKCAEALALRKAFPQELSGLYTGDEMAQADNPAPAPRQLANRESMGEMVANSHATQLAAESVKRLTKAEAFEKALTELRGNEIGELTDKVYSWISDTFGESSDEVRRARAILDAKMQGEVDAALG